MSLTRRRNTRTVLTLVIVIVLAVAGFMVFRKMDFSFLRGLSARSLVYVVPLFVVYQSAGVLAHALLLHDMGYKTSVGRLTTALFASYSSSIAGVAGVGTPVSVHLPRHAGVAPISVGASATSVFYSVELAVTIIIALVGFSYFVPETTFRGTIWLAFAVALTVAFSIIFHLSRRKEVRLPGPGQRLADFLAQIRDGMGRTTVSTLAALVGLVLTKRLVLACTSYVILEDIGNYLPLKGLVFLQSWAILVGFVSMIPLGLGTRDVTTFFLYMRLGLRPEVSAAMAAIERVVWTVVPFCLGIACTALNGVSRRGGPRRGSIR